MLGIRGSARQDRRARKRRRQGAPNTPPPEPSRATVTQRSARLLAVLCLALCLLTAAVYSQTFHYGFVAYDDDQYVYENPRVQEGLTASGVAWAWTTFFYSYWHPLTWISLMLDRQLFGSNAGGFHLTNVVLHMCASVLLLLALFRMRAGDVSVRPVAFGFLATAQDRMATVQAVLEMAPS